MRPFVLVGLLLAVGCGRGSGPGPTPSEPSAAAARDAGPFLGVPDGRSRRLGEGNPASPLADVETVTAVREAAYGDYLAAKQAGRVYAEQRREGYQYFATRDA